MGGFYQNSSRAKSDNRINLVLLPRVEKKKLLKNFNFYLLQLEEQKQKGIRPWNNESKNSRRKERGDCHFLGFSVKPLSLSLSLCQQTPVTSPHPMGCCSAQAYLGFLLSPALTRSFGVWHTVHLLNRTKLIYMRAFKTKEKRNDYLKECFHFLTLYSQRHHVTRPASSSLLVIPCRYDIYWAFWHGLDTSILKKKN